MRKKRFISCVLVLVCIVSMLSGCNSGENKKSESKEHEVITINAPTRNCDAFLDLVHEKYPEINIEIVPYSGNNTTQWMKTMLDSDNLTDIYFSSVYAPELKDVSGKMLDLSGYDFTDNYVQARLRDVTVNNSVYMIPLVYSCLGVTYNKTILEENGWTLPTSLKEMEELKPKVEEAGYTFCVNLLQFPGFGFQYLCNILDTDFLSSTEGLRWQSDYINGRANVSNTPKMLESMKILQRWKDLGLLTENGNLKNDAATRKEYIKGNTLFCVGNTSDLSKVDGAVGEYKLMPYLSEDGSKNVFITQVDRYVGISKRLADAGNEQKLEDALHIMEVLSTEEGMRTINNQTGSTLLPLKDSKIQADSFYSEVQDELNKGNTAPFIYNGWDNVIVPIGNSMIDFIMGNATLEDVIKCMDDNQKLVTNTEAESYTTVTETLDTKDCARMIGIAFAQAVNADVSLISTNEYHRGDKEMNKDGVNGSLFALPVTEQDIVTILPTGWRNNIETYTLSGARIKELASTGYDMLGDGNTYPYELITKEGTAIDDNKTYTVVICGATDSVRTEGEVKDSGVLGLDAAKTYFKQFKSMSKADIIWK